MKKISLIWFFTLCAACAVAQIPDVEVRDINQNWISLQSLKGEELTVFDFWATWCKPCVTSIPKLNAIYNTFSDKRIEFVGVNIDAPRSLSKVKPFTEALGINYPQVLDPNQDLVNLLNVSVFPTLIVYNSEGQEVFVHEGFNAGDEELIREKLMELLNR